MKIDSAGQTAPDHLRLSTVATGNNWHNNWGQIKVKSAGSGPVKPGSERDFAKATPRKLDPTPLLLGSTMVLAGGANDHVPPASSTGIPAPAS